MGASMWPSMIGAGAYMMSGGEEIEGQLIIGVSLGVNQEWRLGVKR
jgi:hypothetical protein